METQKQKQYVSDILTEADIDSWKPSELVLITAGTGQGKTYFVHNVLIPYAKRHGQKVIMLVNRTALKEQLQNSGIDVMYP